MSSHETKYDIKCEIKKFKKTTENWSSYKDTQKRKHDWEWGKQGSGIGSPRPIFLAQKQRFNDNIWTNFLYEKFRNQLKDSCAPSKHEISTLMLIGNLLHPLIILPHLGMAPCDEEETPSSRFLPGEENKRLDHTSNDLTWGGRGLPENWFLFHLSQSADGTRHMLAENTKEFRPYCCSREPSTIEVIVLPLHTEGSTIQWSPLKKKENSEMYITNVLAFGGTA